MFNAINRYFQNHGRHKAREQLLNMSDRQLEDMGLSRDLLRRGIHYWPWREELDAAPRSAQPKKMTTAEINRAVRELSDMSDKELRDLGISRSSIQQIVRGTDKQAA